MKTPGGSFIDQLMPELGSLFETIRRDSKDGEGVTRDAFGPRETRASNRLAAFAVGKGLQAGPDTVGNLHIAAADQFEEAPDIIIASHLDSVPVGGNYDGLAGVVAGVAVLCAVVAHKLQYKLKIRVIGFRGEESPWFSQAYLGSRLLLGELRRHDLEALCRYDTGKTLAEHIVSIGGTVGNGTLQPTLDLRNLKAYYELHIEQAPLLEHMKLPVAIATAIRGNIRHPFAACRGQYTHSGAVPRQFRHDALIASAKLIAFADNRWQELIAAGNTDLVFTCGIFQTDSAEHAMTKVPGVVNFTLNIGGTNNEVMETFQSDIDRQAAELGREQNVIFDFGKRVRTPAITLDASLISELERASGQLGFAPFRMPTVGHDAAMFQRRGIPAAVVLVRNANGSHNPHEHMELNDFAAGTKLLATHLLSRCESRA